VSLSELGFLRVPDALDAGWIARLQRAFDAPLPPGTAELLVGDATPDLEAWDRLAGHPLVRAAGEHLLGARFEVGLVRGRSPRPSVGPQALHADGDEVATVLFLLDDFDEDNGATRVVPGSHRRGPVPLR
jgi:hypothetical protein